MKLSSSGIRMFFNLFATLKDKLACNILEVSVVINVEEDILNKRTVMDFASFTFDKLQISFFLSVSIFSSYLSF